MTSKKWQLNQCHFRKLGIHRLSIEKNPYTHSFSRHRCQAKVEAWKFTLLEKLPPVLILHLKYFIYDSKGGLQKLSKKVEYPVDLEINKGILSHSIRTASPHRYKLFAGEFNKLSVLCF